MTNAQRPFSEIEPADEPRPLTNRQQEFYDYLVGFVEQEERWPTYDEAAYDLGYKSKNSICQMLKALYARGWIDRHGVGEWRFTVGSCPFCGHELDPDPDVAPKQDRE